MIEAFNKGNKLYFVCAQIHVWTVTKKQRKYITIIHYHIYLNINSNSDMNTQWAYFYTQKTQTSLRFTLLANMFLVNYCKCVYVAFPPHIRSQQPLSAYSAVCRRTSPVPLYIFFGKSVHTSMMLC